MNLLNQIDHSLYDAYSNARRLLNPTPSQIFRINRTIASRRFLSLATHTRDKVGSEGWDPIGEGGRESVLTLSSPKFARITYPVGFKSGASPAWFQYNWTKVYPQVQGILLDTHIQLAPNFSGHGTGTNKLAHIWFGYEDETEAMETESGNKFFLSAEGKGDGPLVLRGRCQGDEANTPHLLPNRFSRAILQRGVVYHIQVGLFLDNSAERRHTALIWIDNELTHAYSPVVSNIHGEFEPLDFIYPTEKNSRIDQLQLAPTRGGTGGTILEKTWIEYGATTVEEVSFRA